MVLCMEVEIGELHDCQHMRHNRSPGKCIINFASKGHSSSSNLHDISNIKGYAEAGGYYLASGDKNWHYDSRREGSARKAFLSKWQNWKKSFLLLLHLKKGLR